MKFAACITCAVLALAAPAMIPSEAHADGASGRFVHISDVHFSPFDPPELAPALAALAPEAWSSKFASFPDRAMSSFGKDTNHALLKSAVQAFTDAAAGADFAIVTGDLLAHRFEEQAAEALGRPEMSETVKAFAASTTVFVAAALGDAFAGKPVIVSLGNNDSACGDYRIDPGGDYLATTRETVRRLAGSDRVESDFDKTYAMGGYYGMRHPTISGTSILVLNDILWSRKYRNSCGTTGLAAATEMMEWLTARLREKKQAGLKVWLVHHIPVGIDPYSTTKDKADTCPARVTGFLKEPFASQYLKLLVDFSDIIEASFAGHVHFDDYRLIISDRDDAVGVEKIAPAISPIFGQNPGFHVFTYDRVSGGVADFSTYYLAGLGTAGAPAGDWRLEYTFTQAYGQPRYAPETVWAMARATSEPGPVQETFRRLYNVSRGALDEATLSAYSCAIRYQHPEPFTACYCGG
jgi:hypothetical protein